jgi:hypothetical protein
MEDKIEKCGTDKQCIKNVSGPKRGKDNKVDFKLSDEHRDALRDYDIAKKEKELLGYIPKFNDLPAALKVQLLQSSYRGDIGSDSPETIKLINQGKWEEAAVEFLRHKEYLDPETSTGIKSRMEATAEELRNMMEPAAEPADIIAVIGTAPPVDPDAQKFELTPDYENIPIETNNDGTVPPVDPLVLKPEELPTQQNFDNLPYGKAFNAADKAGLDRFNWKGKSYTTEKK